MLFYGGQKGLRGTQTIQDVAIGLGCRWELDGKTLLLRTKLALEYVQNETNFELTRKYSPCLLVYIIPYDAMQVAGGEKSSLLLPCSGPFIYNTNLLPRCIWDMLSSRDFVPGTINMVKSPWLGRAWAQGIYRCFVKWPCCDTTFFMLIYVHLCCSQFWSEKLSFAEGSG